jgi:hypothetical protein
MNDPFGHLERLQRELGNIAFQLTSVQFARFGGTERWRPAVNAYRCADRLRGASKGSLLTIDTKRTMKERLCPDSRESNMKERSTS